ncbi:MAG: hypothetical protein EP344_02950 [Bacteroidetes bacterium]|nr:MAG: hypothetical protein EP344_02950 [Bacteroidota bacterium]
MYNQINERNAARRRRSALVLAIFVHLAVAAALYLGGSGHSALNDLLAPQSHEETRPAPQPQAVKLP